MSLVELVQSTRSNGRDDDLSEEARRILEEFRQFLRDKYSNKS